MNRSVAVVGAGAWGKNHVRAFYELNALAGVVESSALLRRKIQNDLPDLAVWSSLEEALPHVAGVVVATPAETHADLAMMALEAGKSVLVEKPMARDSATAERLVRAAARLGSTLMVGHLLLFHPALRKLKEILDTGVIGPVRRVNQFRVKHGPVKSGESVLWSFAPHDVAVLLFLMGEFPSALEAQGAAFLQPGVHDDVHLELAFSGGRTAHIHAGWYYPERRVALQVLGCSGMIVYDEIEQTLVLHRKYLAGPNQPDPLAPIDFGVLPLHRDHADALLRQDQHFLECTATGERPCSDGQTGLDVVRVLEWADLQLRRQGILATPTKESV